MTDSVREQIQSNAQAAVGGQWGLAAIRDDSDLPFTSLDDGTDSVSSDEYGRTDLAMAVAVTRVEKSTSSDLEELRIHGNRILAEIQAEMFADETLGGVADGVDYAGGGTSANVGKYVFALANFNIRYHHVRGDPYTIEE
jgi:hypothetical protein